MITNSPRFQSNLVSPLYFVLWGVFRNRPVLCAVDAVMTLMSQVVVVVVVVVVVCVCVCVCVCV